MNLMFQPQFEPLIVSGRKYHTIRSKRKIPLRHGQPLSLRVWTGKPYRSKQRAFLSAKVWRVGFIAIAVTGITLNGKPMTPDQAAALAYHDGFESLGDLIGWFHTNHSLPFVGEIIYWKSEQPSAPAS